MNIKIRLDTGEWVDARPYQIDAFKQFKNSDNPFSGEREEFIYDNGLQGFDKIKFTIRRMGDRYHGGIYMIKENGSISPIADWNDVKVFLLDRPNVNWYDARNYQTWAYFDFIYSAEPIRRYQKGYPSNPVGYTEIPLNEYDVLPIIPPIDFEIARNDNGTIFYKKNDMGSTRVRISDNQQARNVYLGDYRRMTDMADFIAQPVQPVAQQISGGGRINNDDNTEQLLQLQNTKDQLSKKPPSSSPRNNIIPRPPPPPPPIQQLPSLETPSIDLNGSSPKTIEEIKASYEHQKVLLMKRSTSNEAHKNTISQLKIKIQELESNVIDNNQNNSNNTMPPDEYCCPITFEIMSDPCICSDGNTYERRAIEDWLRLHNTSPLTNIPLAHKSLIPNLTLKVLINEWKHKHGYEIIQVNPIPIVNNDDIIGFDDNSDY